MTSGFLRLHLIALLFAATFATSHSFAASRSWTGRDGTTLKADLAGVKDGVVVLRSGRQPHYIPFPHFVLDDRDYIVETFTRRKKPELIAQLLAAALRNPLGIDDQPAVTQPSVLPEAVARRRREAARDAAFSEMYGLSLPSPVMLQLSESRVWTDLLGRQVEAQFESVTAEGNVTLRSGYISKKLPLVAFVRSDIDFIKEALKADLEIEVFPPGELQPLTAEQTTNGYRVWNDRKGVMLNGKFVRRSDRNVILEVDGTNREFPFHGLSEADRDWIDQENERRAAAARAQAEAARAQAEAAQNARAAAAGGTGMAPGPAMPAPGGMPSSRRFGPSTPTHTTPSIPEYQFHCDECGHSWTNVTSVDLCPNCSRGGGTSNASSGTGNSYGGANSSSSSRSSAYDSGYQTGRRIGRYSGLGGLIAIISWGIRWLVRRDD